MIIWMNLSQFNSLWMTPDHLSPPKCRTFAMSHRSHRFSSPAEMKEMKESAFGTGCAQKSEANISAISFISAGQSKSKGPLIF